MSRARRGSALSAAGRPYNYRDVGRTRDEVLPPGYRAVSATRRIGAGRARFEEAVERLMTWQMHRRAGLVVEGPDGPVRAGVVAVLGLGVGRLRLRAPVRVVCVIDDPDRRGFAYGTLRGHPESGEELFVVRIDPGGTVQAEIRAFSRPGSWLTRLGGPVARRVQDRMTQRYLDALQTRA